MEADLQALGVDYRDRWRVGPDGRRLTLRRIAVLVMRYPRPGSHVVQIEHGTGGWGIAEHLLDDIRRHQLVRSGVKNPEPYPGRFPKCTEERRDPAEDARRRAMQQRSRQRWEQAKGGDA